MNRKLAFPSKPGMAQRSDTLRFGQHRDGLFATHVGSKGGLGETTEFTRNARRCHIPGRL